MQTVINMLISELPEMLPAWRIIAEVLGAGWLLGWLFLKLV